MAGYSFTDPLFDRISNLVRVDIAEKLGAWGYTVEIESESKMYFRLSVNKVQIYMNFTEKVRHPTPWRITPSGVVYIDVSLGAFGNGKRFHEKVKGGFNDIDSIVNHIVDIYNIKVDIEEEASKKENRQQVLDTLGSDASSFLMPQDLVSYLDSFSVDVRTTGTYGPQVAISITSIPDDLVSEFSSELAELVKRFRSIAEKEIR